ncbi:WD40-repeat-containing domain protein, partial [Mycotypha africana]|uniref:WD40-repeat-containing domain protein n=1 Tax=Mycotypha africana TaxID=64632 RepID=UPI00230055FC
YETGTCFKTLQAHTDDILDLDFNHPRGMLVSSSLDGTVKAWDLYRYRCLGNLEGHKSIVRCLQMEGSHLLTGSDDSTLKFWDLSTIPNSSSDSSVISSSTVSDEAIVTNELFTLEGHRAEITAIDFNDTQIVSGSNDKTIRLWNIETQQCLSSLDVLWTSKGLETSSVINHNYAYAAHDFVGALQFWDFALATGTSDGKLKMWDLRTGQAHRTLSGHNAPITCLQFDEVHIVSGSFDKTIRIWDLRTGSVFDTLTYTSPISNLQFDANKIISCGSTSDTINVSAYA